MHDLVTLGEVLLRLAVPAPARVETARQLDVQIGGAEANVAATVARLGLRTAWISALPAHTWGDRVIRELTAHGVDCAHVRRSEGARMGLYFLEYGVPPRPIRVLYDRRDSAFARLGADDIDWEPVRRARLVHLSGVTAGLGEGGRRLVRRAVEEASALSFDVNYRTALWTPPEARQFIEPLLPRTRHLFMGVEEAETVFGLTGHPNGHSRRSRAGRRKRRSRSCAAAKARSCATPINCTRPRGGPRCRSSIRSGPAMRMWRDFSGRRSVIVRCKKRSTRRTSWPPSNAPRGGTSRRSACATSRMGLPADRGCGGNAHEDGRTMSSGRTRRSNSSPVR